jgi:hypothetical protein
MTVSPTPIDAVAPRGGWDHPLFDLENLYRAYRQCRRRQRNTHNALVFERRLEENLVALRDALVRGTYRPVAGCRSGTTRASSVPTSTSMRWTSSSSTS